MSGRTKFIVFDGMDDCGKSTLISDLCRDLWPLAKEIKFKKTLPSGALLRINAEKDFELLFSMFELLDKDKTYLLDRFIVSNLVYDKILRGEDTSLSKKYHAEFKERFEVLEIFLTRPPIRTGFYDDRIKLSQEQFNAGLDEYKKYGQNHQILFRDELDKSSGSTHIRKVVYEQCAEFIIPRK